MTANGHRNGRDLLATEVLELEEKLRTAKAKLRAYDGLDTDGSGASALSDDAKSIQRRLHNLLVLSDSALPLGSFAFSSGLESFLAHTKRTVAQNSGAFNHFLTLSLESMADTTLPYLIHAYRQPQQLQDLDNDLDASITCAVARRASIAQGRALVAVWERSFRTQAKANATSETSATACRLLEVFCRDLKGTSGQDESDDPDQLLGPNGHLPPLFGVLGAISDLPLQQLMYVYLLNHAKTLLSAGIRASVLGPYHAQSLLASSWLTTQIWKLVDRDLNVPRKPQDAGQSVPMIDLWGGRHEVVYSRIFNS